MANFTINKIRRITQYANAAVPAAENHGVAVEKDDTPEVLQRRVMEQAEWLLLPQAIDMIANDKVKVVDGKTILAE